MYEYEPDVAVLIYPGLKTKVRSYTLDDEVTIDLDSQCGQQFHSFEIFTFIITSLSNKYVGV